MENLLNQLLGMDQDQSIVVLFAMLLAFCAATMATVAILTRLGRWGRVALFVSVAAVIIVYRGM